jgi:hypothetical protein
MPYDPNFIKLSKVASDMHVLLTHNWLFEMPDTPGAPVSPCRPLSPSLPLGPLAPLIPGAPGAPCAPDLPGGPGGPWVAGDKAEKFVGTGIRNAFFVPLLYETTSSLSLFICTDVIKVPKT